VKFSTHHAQKTQHAESAANEIILKFLSVGTQDDEGHWRRKEAAASLIHAHALSRRRGMVGRIFLAWPHGASAKNQRRSLCGG